ncbi:hypothetical protein COCSUDRAFT_45326 [Coccomyxa subellipsoidea C-169]|uniref:Uncharacterized protein n=1 Tax=Coccomyxa subellipsoidea (strain C-169) TaxID=574566 RepID=I0YJH2_COCSC|nr:hypothetical protein COCSUDRAFT_45326 [Coccomyxa subellipsoidea C-169]EIE18541.1 hypothetical protein COCSUDRAFT_45326 [Coccomyxa subellipsoidea C-169]|eukprot:XP_005643085.1 hypothetical protein COCSUDRAFT_45326 [Coccomyxa subellipsoidea C-169]
MPAKAEGYPCTLDTNVDPRAHPTHMVLKKIEITATDFLSKLFNVWGEKVAIEKLRKEKEDMQAELHKLQQEKETSNAVEATLQLKQAIEKLRKEKEDMQAELHKLQQEKETSNAVEATLQLKQAIEKLRKEKEDMQAELHKLQQEKETSNAVEATLQLKQAIEKLRKEKEDMQAELHKLQQEKATLQLKQADTSATGGMSGTHLVDSLQKEKTALRKLNRELTCLVNMYREHNTVSMLDEPTEEIGETSW